VGRLSFRRDPGRNVPYRPDPSRTWLRSLHPDRSSTSAKGHQRRLPSTGQSVSCLDGCWAATVPGTRPGRRTTPMRPGRRPRRRSLGTRVARRRVDGPGTPFAQAASTGGRSNHLGPPLCANPRASTLQPRCRAVGVLHDQAK